MSVRTAVTGPPGVDPVLRLLEESERDLVDGAPAGMTCYTSYRDTRIESAMTGVLRDHRGRGPPGYAKNAALHLARTRGIRRTYTGDHEGNVPMPAVNRRFGSEVVAAETTYSRTVGG